MHILVIGGNGFLGSKLVQRFIADTHRVTVIDNMTYNNYDTIPESEYLEFIDDNIINIEKHIDSIPTIERVFYLASPRLCDINSDEVVEEQLQILERTIDIFRDTIVHDRRFYFMSSCSVYGKTDKKVNEESDVMVTSFYSKLKIESEKIIQKENQENFRIFRLSTLYGRSSIERTDVLINNIIDDIKKGNKLEIWDPDAKRPHLYIDDAVQILNFLVHHNFDEPILNIGFDFLNVTKREVMEIIIDILDIKLDVDYQVVNDSRDYAVDFTALKNVLERHNADINIFNYNEGIWDLWVGNINISVEDYDSLIGYYRPATSSPTWYLYEENKLSWPKVWGDWNVIDEATGRMMTRATLREQVTPINLKDNVTFYTKKEIGFKKHIYFVPIYTPNFFELNKHIGFSCVSEKFKKDVKEDRAKIVLYHTLEGYSGGKYNKDLDYINEWLEREKIPAENLYYLHGNLKVDEHIKAKGYKFKGIGVSSFDIWLSPHDMPKEPSTFEPNGTQQLFLSYNRNMRHHRILLCSNLYENDVLHRGRVSVGNFNIKDADEEIEALEKLKQIVPITIDRTLDVNWANDISMEDYKRTFLSIVTETLYDDDILFLSEKIWKPIYMGHPFMVLGNPHTLKYLKDLGFKTFDKWWDESYDNMLVLRDRANVIVNNILKFKEYGDKELLEFREEMKDILIHNQKLFRKMIIDKYQIGKNNFNPQHPILKILGDINNGVI